MDHLEQLNAFAVDLQILVGRYMDEFDLPTASLIGALMMQIRLVEDEQVGIWMDRQDPDLPNETNS